MTSEGDVTCVMNFISVLKTKVKSVFLMPAGAEMYYMQYIPPHWVCTSALGMYLCIWYVSPHWVCTSALGIEGLLCHPGKVCTYADSHAALFFGVLTINPSLLTHLS